MFGKNSVQKMKTDQLLQVVLQLESQRNELEDVRRKQMQILAEDEKEIQMEDVLRDYGNLKESMVRVLAIIDETQNTVNEQMSRMRREKNDTKLACESIFTKAKLKSDMMVNAAQSQREPALKETGYQLLEKLEALTLETKKNLADKEEK